LHDLLEHLFVQCQLGDETFKACVLGLQFFESFGLVGLESAVLVAPAMQGFLADGQALADLGDGQALGEVGLGLSQLGDDLFSRVSFHASSPAFKRLQRLS
jgi:hypothetical protein